MAFPLSPLIPVTLLELAPLAVALTKPTVKVNLYFFVCLAGT